MRSYHRWNLWLTLCLLLGVCLAATARAQTARTSIIIDRQAVRFVTQGEAVELRLMISDQQGEVVFDSGFVHDTALEWPLRNQRGEAVASGLYSYALSTKADAEEKARTQRGHVILDRPSSADRIWVTSDKSASIGAESAGVRLTVVGSGEVTVGGAELEATARHRDRTGEGQVSEGRRTPPTRAVSEEKQQDTSAVTASPNRLAKFAADGSTLVDSAVTETATGDIGIGTPAPGGVLDLQRASSGDILQRLWNTGSGGAKLRYVAATGATSQLQLTDGLEWLMAIAGNNSTGMQFRVRNSSDPNSEAALAAAARMTILRNGNVGIGTTNPQARLVVNAGGSGGEVQFSAPSGETGMAIVGNASNSRADVRFDGSTLKLVAAGGGGVPLPTNGIVIDTQGLVGIGTATPQARLAVNAGGSGGEVRFSAPSGESGMSIVGTNRADVRFDGQTLKLLAGTGATAPCCGLAINTAGNVGIGTTTPALLSGGTGRLVSIADSLNPGIALTNTGAGGRQFFLYSAGDSFRVFDATSSADRLTIDRLGNAKQERGSNGLVKAMVYVDANGNMVRCYNSQLADGGASLPPSGGTGCAISIAHSSGFADEVTFNFQVSDRFVSITPRTPRVATGFSFGSSTSVLVTSYLTDVDFVDSFTNSSYMLFIY
ncbi:MAG TPA: hypothetical protein VFD58_26805 [Blastocatellia bacterium]|nr:hypothetical protein [Blastocatellia bacterium]